MAESVTGFYQPVLFVTFAQIFWCFNALQEPTINENDSGHDVRKAELEAWLSRSADGADVTLEAASDDASFRRYFRLTTNGGTFIAMDAPPPQEDCLPFVTVAGHLEAMQLNAPRVIEADLERGFLLLSDLGSMQYLEALEADPRNADVLYEDAINALVRMQQLGTAYQASLPSYDRALLERELALFHDWLCGTHLGLDLSDDDEREWTRLCERLVRNALDQPQVFVHRDYHSRNLMVRSEANPGILDFQDAVEGPLTYDLVSLLKDCYITWPVSAVDLRIRQFYAQLEPSLRERVDELQFRRYFELMGVQRHLKAAGIFARLNHRDGKSRYLADIPRTLAYITELVPRYEELGWLGELIETRVLPGFGVNA